MISVVAACLNIVFDTGSHESLGMRFAVSGFTVILNMVSV